MNRGEGHVMLGSASEPHQLFFHSMDIDNPP